MRRRSASECEKKKDGEMTDTGRPAQTGQYRSVPPSRSHPSGCEGGALFTFEQLSHLFWTIPERGNVQGVCKSVQPENWETIKIREIRENRQYAK
jgi:hypothetical protein